MLNNYKDITTKYVIKNKKRTILTIIGVILSVALISSIGFFFKSMIATQVEDAKNGVGSWHVKFLNPSQEQINKIKNNPSVKSIGIYSEGTTQTIQNGLSYKKIIATPEALKLLPYKLKEGRMPTNNKEIAIEEWFRDKIDYKCTINQNIKIGDKEYKLVGILKNKLFTQFNEEGDLVTIDNINSNEILLVEFKNSKNLKHSIEQIKKLGTSDKVVENSSLIRALGAKLPPGLKFVMGIIIGIVVISSMAVIYNAFQIGVVNRVKHFGLLRAIGATPKQIRKVVFREATIISLIGIPLGLLCGIVALYGIDIVFKMITNDKFSIISPTISKDIVFVSIFIGLVSVYGSAFIPARYASKISPLVAISSRFMINKEKIKRRKSFLIYKLFGFEGMMANKNIKRNKKRYRITVFSISLSIMLFILFSFLVDMIFGMYRDIGELKNIHYIISNKEINSNIDENIIDEISNISYIKDIYTFYGSYQLNAIIDKNKENQDLKKKVNIYKEYEYNGTKKSLLDVALYVYDDSALEVSKKYLKQGEINLDKLNKENGVIIIENNTFSNPNTKSSYLGKAANLKVGDTIYLGVSKESNGVLNNSISNDKIIKNVKVSAILEKAPFNASSDPNTLKVITTKKVAENLLYKETKPKEIMVVLKDKSLQKEAKWEIQKIVDRYKDLNLIDTIDELGNVKSIFLMVKILLYGFVVVVSLIGSVNIVNTLATNIVIRRREFASLKSIGLTQNGLKKMILLEGMMYGVSGLIVGSVSGVLLSYLLFTKMTMTIAQTFTMPFKAIFISFIVVLMISYISIQLPIKKIEKDNLIDIVREDY